MSKTFKSRQTTAFKATHYSPTFGMIMVVKTVDSTIFYRMQNRYGLYDIHHSVFNRTFRPLTPAEATFT